jgi:hypothetical protein
MCNQNVSVDVFCATLDYFSHVKVYSDERMVISAEVHMKKKDVCVYVMT